MGELLPYHRIKRRAEHVCDECIEEDSNKERTCFICGRRFSKGRVFGEKQVGGSSILRSILSRQQFAQMTPEEKEAMRKKYAEANKDKVVSKDDAANAIEKLKQSQKKGRPMR
jgi:hypothetical protein